MSRGLGRIERAIDAAFAAEPENAFTVEDLCDRVYRGVNHVEKKHRVAVLRAMRKLASMPGGTRWYGEAASEGLGRASVFFDRLNLMSYAIGRAKASAHGYRYRPSDNRILKHWRADEAQVRAMFEPGGKWHGSILPGGGWHSHVEAWKAEYRGDAETARRIWDKNERDLRRLLGKPHV